MALTLWRRGRRPLVAVLRLFGVVTPAPQPFRGAFSLFDMNSAIERAFAMRKVAAVALAINSPGGSAVQSALIAKRVRSLARDKDLPVFAFVEDVAASGGYWLACAADEIYADPSSIIGSIGVVSTGFGFSDAIQRFGIERRVHVQGKRKMLLDPFGPEQADDVLRLQALQQDVHQAFKSQVRERRGKRLRGDDETLFNGDIWTGQKALELGLIDGLGDLHGVLRDRFGEHVRLRVVSPGRGWLRRRLGYRARLSPRGLGFEPWLGPDWLGSALTAMEARALWARFGL